MGLRLAGHPTELIEPAGLHCVCVCEQPFPDGGSDTKRDEELLMEMKDKKRQKAKFIYRDSK